MATTRTAAIGMLASGTNAPRSTARPPNISTKIVSHPMRCGAGTPSACKMAGNASRPLAILAKPCSMKPYPTIRRSGIGAQRAIGDLLIRSMGRSRHVVDRLSMLLVDCISNQSSQERVQVHTRATGLLPFTRTVANGLNGRPLIGRRLYRRCEEIRFGHLIEGQGGCRSDAHTKRIFAELN